MRRRGRATSTPMGIGCPPRRSGNTPAGQARAHATALETRCGCCRTTGGSTRTPPARPIRRGRRNRIRGGCTICMETSRNGATIAMRRTTTVAAPSGIRAGRTKAASGCCAAGPGSPAPTPAAPPTGPAIPPSTTRAWPPTRSAFAACARRRPQARVHGCDQMKGNHRGLPLRSLLPRLLIRNLQSTIRNPPRAPLWSIATSTWSTRPGRDIRKRRSG